MTSMEVRKRWRAVLIVRLASLELSFFPSALSSIPARSYPNAIPTLEPFHSPVNNVSRPALAEGFSSFLPLPAHLMDHSVALSQPLIDSDAGRRYSGAQRHRRENGVLISPNLSPTRSPYPLPYYHPRNTKINPKLHRDSEPLITAISSTHLSSTDEFSLPSSAPRHLRHSVPDVIYKHGPRIPSSSSLSLHGGPAAIHGTRARFVSLPAVVSSFPNIDTECDRLERACGRTLTAHLRLRDDPPPSSPHQPRGNGPPPPLAPKWSHWALVLRIKRALRRDGNDIRDYVEADQIDELFRRDVEERGRRERERGRMARMRSGQELSDSDENTRSSLFSCRLSFSFGARAGADGFVVRFQIFLASR